MRIAIFKYLFTISFISVLTGCATFQPQPVSPSETASAFESRTLDNADLKKFLEINLQHEITPWPPKSWDFTMLTLAALYYHPDMDVARAKFGTAEAGVITAGEIPNPSIGFNPTYNAGSGSLSPWTLGFDLNIPVETAGKRGYRTARAKYLSDAAKLNIAATAWQVRSRLRKSLIDFYNAFQMEAVLAKQLAVQEEMSKLMEERLAVGEASQVDVTQLRIALDSINLSLRETQAKKAESRVKIADALGLPVSGIQNLEISFEFLERIPLPLDFPLQDIRRQALINRSDILSALSEYEAAQSALQLEIARQYPDIHLGPGYTWDQGDNKWSLGFSVALPIFNRNQGPIAEAESRRKEKAASFISIQARVIGEIDLSLTSYNAALNRSETADAVLSGKKKYLQSLEAMFNAGEADRFALLNAEQELVSARLSRLDALINIQRSFSLLEDAVEKPLEGKENKK